MYNFIFFEYIANNKIDYNILLFIKKIETNKLFKIRVINYLKANIYKMKLRSGKTTNYANASNSCNASNKKNKKMNSQMSENINEIVLKDKEFNNYFIDTTNNSDLSSNVISCNEKISLINILPSRSYKKVIKLNELYSYNLKPFENIHILIDNIKSFMNVCKYFIGVIEKLKHLSSYNSNLYEKRNIIILLRKLTWVNCLYNFLVENLNEFEESVNTETYKHFENTLIEKGKELSSQLIAQKKNIENKYSFSEEIEGALYKLAYNLEHFGDCINEKKEKKRINEKMINNNINRNVFC